MSQPQNPVMSSVHDKTRYHQDRVSRCLWFQHLPSVQSYILSNIGKNCLKNICIYILSDRK